MFELPGSHIHFHANTLKKGMNPSLTPHPQFKVEFQDRLGRIASGGYRYKRKTILNLKPVPGLVSMVNGPQFHKKQELLKKRINISPNYKLNILTIMQLEIFSEYYLQY